MGRKQILAIRKKTTVCRDGLGWGIHFRLAWHRMVQGSLKDDGLYK